MAKIVPGILTADEEEYYKRLTLAEHVCDLVQIDIIDGKFANNTTVGPEIVKKYPTSANLEIQLMVVNPQEYVKELGDIEYVSRIIFSLEIEKRLIRDSIYDIRKVDKQAGISLNPETPVAKCTDYFGDIDLLLLMTGKPGFSGQKLGEETYGKIEEAKKLAPELPVEIDIGVNFENAQRLAKTGADFLVSTSAIYNADDFFLAYEKLSKLVESS